MTTAADTTKRRLIVGGLDQAISSGWSLLFFLVGLALLPRVAFGQFALATTTIMASRVLVRAVAGEPLLITRNSTGEDRSAVDAALVVSVGLALLTSLGFWLAGALPLVTATATGCCIVSVAGHDMQRHIAFARRRPLNALHLDTQLLLTAGALMFAAYLIGTPHPAQILGCLAVAAIAATWMSAYRLQVAPSHDTMRSARAFVRERRALIGPLVLDQLGMVAAVQGTAYLVGARTGIEGLGGFRAAEVFVNPMNLVILALPPLLLPEMRHLTPRRAGGAAALASTVASVAVLVWAGVLAILPDAVWQTFSGDFVAEASMLAPILACRTALGALTIGPVALIKSSDRPHVVITVRFITAALALGAVLIGTGAGTVTTRLAWALVIANAISAVVTAVLAAPIARRSLAATSSADDAVAAGTPTS